MTKKLEKKMIQECLEILQKGDKDLADKYNQTIEKIETFKMSRLEALLSVVDDELSEDIAWEQEQAEKALGYAEHKEQQKRIRRIEKAVKESDIS